MSEFKVVIPKEDVRVVNFKQDDLPGVAVINSSLTPFEPKIVFAWHLSVMIHYDDFIENGMPSQNERDIIDPWGDQLDAIFKGESPEQPNALFLARITWNETRELIYRVFNPEPINDYLSDLLTQKTYARPFDFRIDNDSDWDLAKWHLNAGYSEE